MEAFHLPSTPLPPAVTRCRPHMSVFLPRSLARPLDLQFISPAQRCPISRPRPDPAGQYSSYRPSCVHRFILGRLHASLAHHLFNTITNPRGPGTRPSASCFTVGFVYMSCLSFHSFLCFMGQMCREYGRVELSLVAIP